MPLSPGKLLAAASAGSIGIFLSSTAYADQQTGPYLSIHGYHVQGDRERKQDHGARDALGWRFGGGWRLTPTLGLSAHLAQEQFSAQPSGRKDVQLASATLDYRWHPNPLVPATTFTVGALRAETSSGGYSSGGFYQLGLQTEFLTESQWAATLGVAARQTRVAGQWFTDAVAEVGAHWRFGGSDGGTRTSTPTPPAKPLLTQQSASPSAHVTESVPPNRTSPPQPQAPASPPEPPKVDQIVPRAPQLVRRFACKAHFWANGTAISQYSSQLLGTCAEGLAAKLADNPHRRVLVLGYWDQHSDIGGDARLAKSRAEAVAQRLMDRGIPQTRIEAQYFEAPSEDGPAGIDRRRAEVWLLTEP